MMSVHHVTKSQQQQACKPLYLELQHQVAGAPGNPAFGKPSTCAEEALLDALMQDTVRVLVEA